MKKTVFVIDSKTGTVCCAKSVSASWDINESPRRRKGENLISVGLRCGVCGLLTGFVNRKFSLLQVNFLDSVAIGLSWLAFLLLIVGTIYIKFAERKPVQSNRHFGSWRDPYGLAHDDTGNEDPAKKTYYIVDSETNAIVDVKRLGKWGQAYIEWRGKRQK